ncbi:MAG: MotA/TolQ/ExbB proton channel family protein [Oxalobacter sp.]|nr:MotA/TolQ/ExbB proton channel family protein [Oxalobacter sp.]
METTVNAFGFSHFITHSDFLGKFLFFVLVAMSIVSWTIIIVKGIAAWKQKNSSQAFLQLFWNASSLESVQHEIQVHGIQCPFSHLTAHAQHAKAHHQSYGASKLSEAGTQQDFIIRTMRMVIDEDATRLAKGLTVLATIGSTAPFVGLFGTVWGIYHALVAIGMGGSASLAQVAGPVGEALIMTGIGLATAIPAVIGYNWLLRMNNVTLAKLDAFANELLTFLTTGKPYLMPQASDASDVGGGRIVAFARKEK